MCRGLNENPARLSLYIWLVANDDLDHQSNHDRSQSERWKLCLYIKWLLLSSETHKLLINQAPNPRRTNRCNRLPKGSHFKCSYKYVELI